MTTFEYLPMNSKIAKLTPNELGILVLVKILEIFIFRKQSGLAEHVN